MRYHYTSPRAAKTQNMDNPKCRRGWAAKGIHSFRWDEAGGSPRGRRAAVSYQALSRVVQSHSLASMRRR